MEETMIITTEVPNKRRKVTKFALAGVAVLGVSAAATSAAWSDNVFFGAEAAAADFELQGQNPNGTWVNADTDGNAAILLPASAFDKVGPGIGDTYRLRVRNSGDLPIYLNKAPIPTVNGDLFSGLEAAQVTFGAYNDVELTPGQTASFDVTVTGPTTWEDSDYQGLRGNMVIRVEGSSSAAVAPLPTP